MGKKNKPLAVHNWVSSYEPVWYDKRTGIRLAPGAIRNWPTAKELAEIDQLNAEQARQLRLLRELSKKNPSGQSTV